LKATKAAETKSAAPAGGSKPASSPVAPDSKSQPSLLTSETVTLALNSGGFFAPNRPLAEFVLANVAISDPLHSYSALTDSLELSKVVLTRVGRSTDKPHGTVVATYKLQLKLPNEDWMQVWNLPMNSDGQLARAAFASNSFECVERQPLLLTVRAVLATSARCRWTVAQKDNDAAFANWASKQPNSTLRHAAIAPPVVMT